MASRPTISPGDLETMRLGHFGALRRIDDGYGTFAAYAVIGQPIPWPKREASIARLVGMGILEVTEDSLGAVERPLKLTGAGERLYKRFVELLETGELKKILEKFDAASGDAGIGVEDGGDGK